MPFFSELGDIAWYHALVEAFSRWKGPKKKALFPPTATKNRKTVRGIAGERHFLQVPEWVECK